MSVFLICVRDLAFLARCLTMFALYVTLVNAQQIWLAPDGGKTPDYRKLFSESAPWRNAASKVSVFKIQGPFDDYPTLIQDMNRRGIALAWDLNGLTYDGTCSHDMDGFVPPVDGNPAGNTLNVARYLKSLGADVKFVAFNLPYQNGALNDGPNACHWSADKVAQNLLLHVQAIQSVFPNALIGDMEGVPQNNNKQGQMLSVYQPWLDAFKKATGKELAFLQVDVGWGVADYASDLEDMRKLLKSRGIEFGIMYAGHSYFKPANSAQWSFTAERDFTRYELAAGPPDQGIIQSWDEKRLPLALPEDEPGTLTNLVNRYARERPVLTASLAGNEVTGRLTNRDGLGLAASGVTIGARSVSGAGIPADTVISGFVPLDSNQGTAGFRINDDCNRPCKGPADITLYRIAYADSTGQTATYDFSSGLQGWSIWGTAWNGVAKFETDPAAGRGLHLSVGAQQSLGLNSPVFKMTPGATFTITITARVPPGMKKSGNYSMFLLNGNAQTMRYDEPLDAGTHFLGTAVTRADGTFSFTAAKSFASPVVMAASYSGTEKYWPAVATTVSATSPNEISIASVVNAASFRPALARCALATLYGKKLAASTLSASVLPLPKILGETEVKLGGASVPLLFVSPEQVNFQVPCELPLAGTMDVTVRSGASISASHPVTLVPYAPAVFTYERAPGAIDPIIVHSDNSLVTPENPAKMGEPLVIYSTGLGNVVPVPLSGTGSPFSPLGTAVDTPVVTVGGVPGKVLFAGLTPGLVGVLQINFDVPSGLPNSGTLPLVLRFLEIDSPAVNLAVGK